MRLPPTASEPDSRLYICTAAELRLSLPRSGPFLGAHLSGADADARIRQAEGG